MFAPLPGVSRSGLTIAISARAGVLADLGRRLQPPDGRARDPRRRPFRAARHSHGPALLTPDRIAQTLAATIVAGIVGYVAIIWLMSCAGRAIMVFFCIPGCSGDRRPGCIVEDGRIARCPPTTGYGPARRQPRCDCLLTELAGEPGGLWIVPTPLARDQLSRRLCLGNSGHGPAPRVYCWSDLWRLVRREVEEGPAWFSSAAIRTVFQEAIRQLRDQGQIAATHEAAIGQSGYQRRLQERFQAWTIAECHVAATAELPARGAEGSLFEAAEWSLYFRYRQLLAELVRRG